MSHFAPISVLVVLVGLCGTCAPAQVLDANGNLQGSTPGPEIAGAPISSIVHTVSGGARQAEVVIDHDGFPLDDRRACRVEASRVVSAARR